MLRSLGVFPLARLAALCLLAAAVLVLALERDTLLFLNLGPGDDPFTRGFRNGWERDGTLQSGETLFRWTEDGARLELPVVLAGTSHALVRLRMARFLDTPVEMNVFAGERLVDHWTQAPRGWVVRSIDLGAASGPLQLRFRSTAPDPQDPLGVALDWVEVSGAGRLWPRGELVPGLLMLFCGLPLLCALVLGPRAGLVGSILVFGMGAAVVSLDRLGGLVALSRAGFSALLCAAVLAAAARLGLRAMADAALPMAIGVASLVLVALSHPGFYYPDVDTHARYVQAIRRDPGLAWNPSTYQEQTGAWTREIAGVKVAFPYSPAFHLLAWPLAPLAGEVAAVKAVAVLAVGLSLLLVFALASAAALTPGEALLAQAIFALLPVLSSRLSLALYPTLLGQACELLAVLALARVADLGFWRLAALLALAQAVYTASIFNVAAFVTALAALEAAAGERRRAGRVVLAWMLGALVVGLLLYGRFLPTLWGLVLPHLRESPAAEPRAGSSVVAAAGRLTLFYDSIYPVLAVLGAWLLRSRPASARRPLLATLLGGCALLGLRYVVPTLLRDAKEIEMLAPAVAVTSALALAWLWARGRSGRILACVSALWLLAFGVERAWIAYAERFVAVGLPGVLGRS
jgi:hypothetical protein